MDSSKSLDIIVSFTGRFLTCFTIVLSVTRFLPHNTHALSEIPICIALLAAMVIKPLSLPVEVSVPAQEKSRSKIPLPSSKPRLPERHPSTRSREGERASTSKRPESEREDLALPGARHEAPRTPTGFAGMMSPGANTSSPPVSNGRHESGLPSPVYKPEASPGRHGSQESQGRQSTDPSSPQSSSTRIGLAQLHAMGKMRFRKQRDPSSYPPKLNLHDELARTLALEETESKRSEESKAGAGAALSSEQSVASPGAQDGTSTTQLALDGAEEEFWGEKLYLLRK